VSIPTLLTITEAAKVLKCARSTVYKMVQRGELAKYKVGRSTRISEEDLTNYLQQNHVRNVPYKKPEMIELRELHL